MGPGNSVRESAGNYESQARQVKGQKEAGREKRIKLMEGDREETPRKEEKERVCLRPPVFESVARRGGFYYWFMGV